MKAPLIEKVKAVAPGVVELQWKSGETARVDLSRDIVESRYLAPLKDKELFSQVKVGEWGHSIAWTDDLDLGADMLWRRSLAALGRNDTLAFAEWRAKHGLSLTETARALGMSRRMVAYYESGAKTVPRTVLLACRGWEAESGVAGNHS